MFRTIISTGLVLSTLLVMGVSPADAAPKPKNVKVAMSAPDNDPMVLAMRGTFAKYVEEKSNGRYKVTVYPSQALGATDTIISSLRMGMVHFSSDSTSGLSVFAPELSLFDLPYMLPSREAANKVFESPVGEKLFVKLGKQGVTTLGVVISGYRTLETRSFVRNINDVKNFKIRTTASAMDLAGAKAFGMVPTPMAASEMFTGVQQGVVEGFFPDLANIAHRRFYEVAPHILFINHAPVCYVFNTSSKWFKSLSAEDQAIFNEAAKEYVKQATINCIEMAKSDQARIAKYEGVTFTVPTDEEMQGWRKAGMEAYKALNPEMKILAEEIQKIVQ